MHTPTARCYISQAYKYQPGPEKAQNEFPRGLGHPSSKLNLASQKNIRTHFPHYVTSAKLTSSSLAQKSAKMISQGAHVESDPKIGILFVSS